MILRKVIKKNARAAMKGNYGRAALILLISMAVATLLGALDSGVYGMLGLPQGEMAMLPYLAPGDPADISAALDALAGATVGTLPTFAYTCVMTLVELLIFVPLGLGVMNWYLELTDGRRTGVGEIFWPFGCRAFWRSIWLQICVFFRVWLISLLVVGLPTGALGVAVVWLQESAPNAAAVLTVFAAVAVIILSLLMTVFTFRYAMAQLLLCRKYSLTVGKALKASVRYTKGHRWELFGLTLTFIPWFLLCVFIVPVFFVIPYYTMTLVMYLRYLYEDGLNRDGLLDTSRPEEIIIDDISPEKVPVATAKPVAADEQFYYPPQAWGDRVPGAQPQEFAGVPVETVGPEEPLRVSENEERAPEEPVAAAEPSPAGEVVPAEEPRDGGYAEL